MKAKAGKKKKKDTWKRKIDLRANGAYPSDSHALNHLLEELCWLGGAQEGQPAQLPAGGGHEAEATTSYFSYDVVIEKQRNQFYNWEL